MAAENNFIVSARKYRPTAFESVVGQQSITDTLTKAIATDQLASGYLFCGPRGVGKTTCARIFAKEINKSINGTESDFSFNIFELDAASNNSVDDIRSLVDQVRIPPQTGKYKVYIIDEVHMLSVNAFNAFLKTLEEPPAHAIFILATTEKHKIIPTILSRCQVYDFHRISQNDMANHLKTIADKEEITYEEDALHVIAEKADGGLRDALSIFDQVASSCNKNITYKATIENLNILDYSYYFKVVDLICEENISQSLIKFNEVLMNGYDGRHFLNGLAQHYRNLLVVRSEETVQLLDVSTSIKNQFLEQSKKVDIETIFAALNVLSESDVQYVMSKNKRLHVELALMQLCSIKQHLLKKKAELKS